MIQVKGTLITVVTAGDMTEWLLKQKPTDPIETLNSIDMKTQAGITIFRNTRTADTHVIGGFPLE